MRKIFEITSASIILNFLFAIVARTLNASTTPESWVKTLKEPAAQFKIVNRNGPFDRSYKTASRVVMKNRFGTRSN